jgi:hypothetical protein
MRLDNLRSLGQADPDEGARFEREVRKTASLAVAHLRRGERVFLRTSSGAKMQAVPSGGADATLRFLALIDLEEPGVAGAPSVHLAGGDEAPPPPGFASESSTGGISLGTLALSRMAELPIEGDVSEEKN